MINIKKFTEIYNKEYEGLYEAHARGNFMAGEDEALDYFDYHLKNNPEEVKILKEFSLSRGDFISSDREAAAFVFALDSYCKEEQNG